MKKFKFKHYSKFDKKNFLFIYCLILLPVLQFALFWVYVHIDSFVLAFQEHGTGGFTFDNFKAVFNNIFRSGNAENNIALMIGRSLILWSISNLLAFPISLASTYVLYRRVWGHYAFRVIFTISGIVGAVVWTTMLKSICGSDGNKIVMYILQNWFHVDLPDKAIQDGLFGAPQTAFPTLCVIMFITHIAGGSVVITGAYAKIPPELMEAAKLDGLDFWGSFFHVALPCSWPTISTLLTIALCSILVADGNVYIFTNGTGGNGMSTMGYYLYYLTVQISKNPATANYGYPAAVGIVVSLVSVPIVLLGRRIITKVIPTVEV